MTAVAALAVTAVTAAERDLRRHRQEPRDFAVEHDGQWPVLFEVFETISHDGGPAAGHAVYFVPEAWTDRLDDVERALHGLTDGERKTIATGHVVDVGLIAFRHRDLAHAVHLLDAFSKDWRADHG